MFVQTGPGAPGKRVARIGSSRNSRTSCWGQGLPRPTPRGTDEELKKLGDESANTWVSEATKGVESVVAVTFEPRGDQTEVTLCHSRVPDDEMGRRLLYYCFLENMTLSLWAFPTAEPAKLR